MTIQEAFEVLGRVPAIEIREFNGIRFEYVITAFQCSSCFQDIDTVAQFNEHGSGCGMGFDRVLISRNFILQTAMIEAAQKIQERMRKQ